MKKKIKGSRWFVLLVVAIMSLPFLMNHSLEPKAKVSNIEWNCDSRPCRVWFDLQKSTSGPIDVVVQIRGYNFSSDLALPRPRILVGKREFREHLASETKTRFFEEIKFTRYPDEIEISIIN